MDKHEFWSLDRNARRDRIEHAEDTKTCSVCEQPLLDGQARDGLVHAHWHCSHIDVEKTAQDIDKAFDSARRAVDKLNAKLRLERSKNRPRVDPLNKHLK